jgi:twitching motility two-component system response regulator PilH
MSRILVVDDSPTETFTVKGILERAGFEVVSASNAEEGMKAARERAPDLILMDVVMPGLNGFQATRQLSRDPLTAAIPIVILTTKNQETDRVWAIRQGARGYLTKPVDERKLLDSVRQALAGAGAGG